MSSIPTRHWESQHKTVLFNHIGRLQFFIPVVVVVVVVVVVIVITCVHIQSRP